MQRRITANRDEAISKILDGEAIIINLVTGAYYSTAGVGAAIWSAIEEGRTTTEIVAAVIARYEVDAGTVAADLERMIDEMKVENLVRVEEASEPAAVSVAEPPGPRAPYDRPEFHVYRDMRDLLALDPPMPVFGDAAAGGGTDTTH